MPITSSANTASIIFSALSFNIPKLSIFFAKPFPTMLLYTSSMFTSSVSKYDTTPDEANISIISTIVSTSVARFAFSNVNASTTPRYSSGISFALA